MDDRDQLAGRHVVFLSWRDIRNPEGGGAERYLETIARGLVARGCRVTVFSAAFAGAPLVETLEGVRHVRRGSKTTVYAQGMWSLLLRRFGHVDVVVDIQNGMPFLSRLATRKPVVVLVHHVHREQWPVVYPGPLGKVGWWVERWLAPRVYRGCQYVAVSRATRDDLRTLGVAGPRIAVVHDGTDPALDTPATKSATPMLCTVGRLVPHKQVEHAIDAVLALREEFPTLRLHVVGRGWWGAALHEYAEAADTGDSVVFEGYVDEARKHEVYESSWVMVLPSLKEGWGLVVSEAGRHRTPTVAYRLAGGTRESIADGRSGVLVDNPEDLSPAIGELLRDPARREALGATAAEMSRRYTWGHAQASFAHVIASTLQGGLMGSDDPEEEDGTGQPGP